MATTYELIVKAVDKTSGPLSRINTNLKRVEQQAKRTGNSMNGVGGKGGSAGIGAIAGAVARLPGPLLAVGAAAGTAAVGFKKMVDASKEFQNIQNQLKLVTNGTADLAATTDLLRQTASANRTSFAATADLFTKLSVSQESLGFNTQQTVQLVSKMSKALAVAGADAATTNAVVRQFGQAMASGTVRGDEFVSIAEGLGQALNVMAKESGISIGQLRDMSQAGELTAKVFADMLLQSTALDEAFGKMSATTDQLETALSDAFDEFLVELGAATGAVSLYDSAIDGTTKAFSQLSQVLKVVNTPFEQFNEQVQESIAKGNVEGAIGAVAQRLTALSAPIYNITDAYDAERKSLIELLVELKKLEIGSTKTGKKQESMTESLMKGVDQVVEKYKSFNREMDREFTLFITLQELENAQDNLNRVIKENPSGDYTKQLSALAKMIENVTAELDKFEEAAEKAAKKAELERFKELKKQFKGVLDVLDDRPAGQTALEKAQDDLLTLQNLMAEASRSSFRLLEGAPGFEGVTQAGAMGKIAELIKAQEIEIQRIKDEAAQKEFDRIQGIIDAGSGLLDFEQSKRREYQETRDEIARLNDELDNNTSLTDRQRNAIEQNVKALERHKDLLHKEIKMGPVVSQIYANSATALQENSDARLDIIKAIDGLEMQMKTEAFQTETNIALLNALNLALEDNERVRLRLLGLPTTLGMDIEDASKRLDTLRLNAERLPEILEALRAKGATNQELIKLGLIDPPKKKDLSASEQLTKRIQDQKKGFDDLVASKANVAAMAEKAGVSVEFMTKQLDEAIESANIFKTEAQIFAEELEEGFRRAGESLSKNLARDLVKGRNMLDSFKNFFDSILEQMLQAVIQKKIMDPLFDSLLGVGGGLGGGGGLLGGLGGSIFGFLGAPGFATGGAATQGQPYVVGEKGPELFMPGTTGRVIPRDDMAAGGGATPVTFQIQALDSKAGTEFILENKNKIINMINSAQRQRGKMGIMD